jgi:DNA-binding NarL/FixJ family response regulator
MKVLIVDDSILLRERLIASLSEIENVEIAGEASDGLKAIDSFKKLNPDVVILDLNMPGMNGMEVLRNIKKDKPSTKVIIFTKYPYPQYRGKCLKLGADFFFDKSLGLDDVFTTIEKLSQDSSPVLGLDK